MKDHLGTIRAVVNSVNTVVSAGDYDAWGYPLQNRSYESSISKYKFTGKERDKESGLNDADGYDYFGARYYNSRVANWTSVDPLFEKHIGFTPYNYVLGNPFSFVDPDGKQSLPEIVTGVCVYLAKNIAETEAQMTRNANMNPEEEAALHGMTEEEFGRGNVEATGDEMLLSGFLESGLKLSFVAEKTAATELLETGVKLSSTTSIEKAGFTLSKHAGEQMLDRGITSSMVSKTLEKGTIYFGHESGALSFILKDAYASGKSLLVGLNPLTKVVTTTIRGSFKSLHKQYLKEISKDASNVIKQF